MGNKNNSRAIFFNCYYAFHALSSKYLISYGKGLINNENIWLHMKLNRKCQPDSHAA